MQLGPIPPSSRKVLYPFLGYDAYTNYALEAALGSTDPVEAASFSHAHAGDSPSLYARASKRKDKGGEEGGDGAGPSGGGADPLSRWVRGCRGVRMRYDIRGYCVCLAASLFVFAGVCVFALGVNERVVCVCACMRACVC